MEKEVTLNSKEQKRLLVLNEVLAGRMTGQKETRVKLNLNQEEDWGKRKMPAQMDRLQGVSKNP
jgi:hypothetical protein